MLPRELDQEAVEYSEDADEWDYQFVSDEKQFPGHHKPGTLYNGDGLRLFPGNPLKVWRLPLTGFL